MSRTLPTIGKQHPLTGAPLRVLGYRTDGRPIYPIMGGDPSNDPPQRPEDVSEEEWNALGDPGKQAIVRVRAERDQAVSAKSEAERALQAARARPAPPRNDPPKNDPPTPKPGDQPDIAALVTEAVNAAFKPFAEREQERDADQAAQAVVSAVKTAADGRFIDSSDALGIDLAAVVDDAGKPDAAKIKTALDKLLETKPHLAKGPRTAPFGVGATTNGSQAATGAEQVKARLAAMQAAGGIRLPSNT